MFKCSECGCEYDKKPDFCDCGNNLFEQINDIPAEKPSFKLNLDKSELLSWVIFFVCIVLSILILIFFPKIDPQPQNKPAVAVKETPQKDIPSLNSFWIDCKPVIEEDVENTEKPIKEVLNIFKPTPKPQAKPQTKPQPQKVVQTTQNKPAAAKTNTQKQQTQVKKPAQQTTVKKPQTTQSSTTDIEMLNYMNGLLNRFKSNLTLSDIDGEGSCVVEFGIDESGKLTNRNFARLSDNKSINDAVYKMMMRTPVYNPPPSSYNGRTIRVYFKLSPSYYEISQIK